MTLHPGQLVDWLYEPRGGYGYRWWVPATVVRVGPKMIVIEANLSSGGTKRVRVTPDRLRSRKPPSPEPSQ